MTAFGILFWAPITTYWMVFLEKIVPGKTSIQLGKKIICRSGVQEMVQSSQYHKNTDQTSN